MLINEIFEILNFPYMGEKSMEELNQSSMNQGFSKKHHDLFEKYLKEIDQEIGRFDLLVNKNQGEISDTTKAKTCTTKVYVSKISKENQSPKISPTSHISSKHTAYLKQHNLLPSF